MIATLSLVIFWLIVFVLLVACLALGLTWKIWLAIIIEGLARLDMFFDNIPEGYATAYESGGKFFALACSYKGFGPVKAPGNLNWAIRKLGDTDEWKPAWKDGQGVEHAAEMHTYTQDDFYWDRRPWFVKRIFGDHTGIVWMGIWPIVRPKYYDLRLNNFRTVKPNKEEEEQKKASVREYMVNGQRTGWLISWSEWTKRVLLSDDVYPFPVDGVRIGAKIGDGTDKKKQQGILANLLVFVRARIRAPYLFLYRAQDTLEIVQNEIIQHVRKLCAWMSLEDVFSLTVTLQSDKEKTNLILAENDFGSYIDDRYGFTAKGASIGPPDIPGAAGEALSAPYVARQNAEAEAERGRGQGEAESNRLTLEGEAFKKVIDEIGIENAGMLRTADVAESFAQSGKSSTVLLGFDLKTMLNGLGGKPGLLPKGKEGVNGSPEPNQPTNK